MAVIHLSTGAPQVSVLIRSIGRASLAAAVQSVQAQTLAEWRVTVIDASGQPRPDGFAALDDPRATRIESAVPLSRSAAANRGLASVTTEFALFLDDDDLLLPDHLQRLVRALEASPKAVAAYAGVECVAVADGAVRPLQVFDDDVSWLQMQLQNRLPIHAVMFRMAALRQPSALGFDEQLDQFEDWDFWLQLMARGPFVRVSGVSAVYRLNNASGSGHAKSDGDQRKAMLERFGARQVQRWTGADAAALIEQHAGQVARLHQAAQALAHERGAVGSLQRTLQLSAEQHQTVLVELDRHINECTLLQRHLDDYRQELDRLAALRLEHLRQIDGLNHTVAALHASSSWRLTRPLRWLADALAAWRTRRWRAQAGALARNLVLALKAQHRRHGLWGSLVRWPGHLLQWRRHLRTLGTSPSAASPVFDFAPVQTPSTLRLHPDIDGTDECLDSAVSVVIPTFNAGAEFALLLRKLRQQRGLRELEIVVVDSGSRDATVALAQAAGARVVQITQAEFSHSHARNLGADAASGDHLVFMVQDAYPIGQRWLYGMLRWLIDHRDEGVVAASCAEYCRSDSDLMYDSMVNTHYRFLGCLEADRIGRYVADDHMSLRSMGQLSDVACMIGRDTFARYRYRGDYAEDLDLGMRLIRDGHSVAMLASIKVIHSHNRSAHYYLKRSFVDVIFLVGLFDDFHHPRCDSVADLLRGVRDTAARVAHWLAALPEVATGLGLDALAPRRFAALGADHRLGEAALDDFVQSLSGQPFGFKGHGAAPAQREAQQFNDSFLARIDHLHQYAVGVYGPLDERLCSELSHAVRKTFAATLGAALAYVYLDRRKASPDDPERLWIDTVFARMKAGV